MTDALTATPWLAVLDRIKRHTDSDTTRTLAAMLWDIFSETDDPKIGEIADAYAYRLLGVTVSVELEELDDENENRNDFRRANGAPMVSDPENPEKWLRYSRPSSYAKLLDDEMALTDWRIWKAMEGVARSKALQTQVVATRDDDKVEKKSLRNKALDKGNASERADQGTGLHAMTVRAEDPTDVDFDPPDEIATDLDAYSQALSTYGLVSEMFEVHMCNDRFRAAGTADRVWRTTQPLILPDGTYLEPDTLLIGDLKTGAKLDFSLPGFCVQTALYATAKLYDVVTQRRLPTPPINNQWALLAHMPVGSGTCTMHWCSVPLGIEGASLAQAVKEWRKLWKNGTYDAPQAEFPKEPSELIIEHFDAEVVSNDVPLDEMAAWCQERINALATHALARKWLMLNWPDGLPTPRKGITTWEQLLTLVTLLDNTEKQFSIPFGVSDPRLRNETGPQRSKALVP